MKRVLKSALVGVCAVILTLGFVSPRAAVAAGRMPSDIILLGPAAKVVQVVDGNTLVVSLNGASQTIKLIGVNAPAPNACGGAAAKAALANLVAGQVDVILEKDTTIADAGGAWPRWVYLRDARMLNEDMVAGGYARAVVQLPDTKHQLALSDLEAAARKAVRGGWRSCGWKSPASSINPQCPTVNAQDLMTRGARPPILNALRDGDCVLIQKPANDAGGAWGGKFVFHPAGSTAKLGQGYLRWKDGFVLMKNDPASGVLSALVEEDRRKFSEVKVFGTVYQIPAGTERFAAMLPLERDPGNAAIVRLPVIGTWLFRQQPSGAYTPLVDYFEYVSGDLKAPSLAANGQLY